MAGAEGAELSLSPHTVVWNLSKVFSRVVEAYEPSTGTSRKRNGSSRRHPHSSIGSEDGGNERKGAEEDMTNIKTIVGMLVAVVAAIVGVVALGAPQASASSRPIVIPYAKTCDQTRGHCVGTAGGVTIDMHITSFRATGKAAKLTATESITVGDISFTAEMTGNVSPAGFIVLNGTVTEDIDGPFEGAQVHQRSNFVGIVDGDPTKTAWTGELRLMPASA